MNKEKVLFILNSIVRRIAFMKDSELEKHFKSDSFEIDFCRYEFEEPTKIMTKIEIKEVGVNSPV